MSHLQPTEHVGALSAKGPSPSALACGQWVVEGDVFMDITDMVRSGLRVGEANAPLNCCRVGARPEKLRISDTVAGFRTDTMELTALGAEQFERLLAAVSADHTTLMAGVTAEEYARTVSTLEQMAGISAGVRNHAQSHE